MLRYIGMGDILFFEPYRDKDGIEVVKIIMGNQFIITSYESLAMMFEAITRWREMRIEFEKMPEKQVLTLENYHEGSRQNSSNRK